ncbi:Leucine-rich repeat [Dillenia turbinata]|uniref:Leucine-rich repeat n=1 Tax=Dillenia turbinata TaxID=194707 RepID=A0AAN8URF9_9MAGN
MKNLVITGQINFILLLLLCLDVYCMDYEANVDSAPMLKTEKHALYSAIQGFVGDWWNGSDLYPDPCGWTPIQGISCDVYDGLWYVTTFNIGPILDNSLTCAPKVEFRPHLFELKHLKSLSFVGCFISSQQYPISIPTDSWENLATALESLEFRSNPGLSGQIPTTFGKLRNLKSLVLLENGLTGELPTSIGNLVKLKRLVLASNSFRGQIPDNFGALTELLIFDLSRNSLSGSLPVSLGGLASLLKLDLSNNGLEREIPEEFGNMKNLILLDLRNNRLSGRLIQSFQEMRSLEELVLSNNSIGGDLMNVEWRNLQNLIILDLSNMNLIEEIPESMSELKRIRFLGLNDNNLTGDISPKLAALPCISALYLYGNRLSGKLQFSEWFYGKMGRRFGAWNNPNLCYPLELIDTNHVPIGVKPCQQEVNLVDSVSRTELSGTDLGFTNSQFLSSLGVSRHRINGNWLAFPIELVLMILMWDLFL